MNSGQSLKHRGFSLVEILIVLVLLGFLSLSTFTAVRSTVQNKETIDRRTEVLQEGRAAFAIIEKDLMAAYMDHPKSLIWKPVPPPKPEEPDTDPPWKAAVFPLAVTVFKGSVNDVFFTSKTHRRSGVNSAENESHFVTLQLAKNQIIRATSTRAVSSRDRENVDRFDTEVLLENVKTLKLKYYDAKTELWVDSWDTEKKDYEFRLPESISIEVEYTPSLEESPRFKPQPVVLKAEFSITEAQFKRGEVTP